MLRVAITRGELTDVDGPEARALVERMGELARDGVGAVLLREKRLGAGALVRLARAAAGSAAGSADGAGAGSAMRVVVPGRADVALAAGVEGVHLSGAAGELSVAEVRAVCGKRRVWVSVSCHGVEEVRRARAGGADAVLFAPVFGKWVEGVEVVAGVGLAGLRAAVQAAEGMPVIALGGVEVGNAWQCAEAGASGVAGIRMFFG